LDNFKVGDTVKIIDGSEAHNNVGKIWHIQISGAGDDLYLIEVDCSDLIDCEYESYIWPVTKDEIELC
jgi:hypothetical protein